MQDPERSTLMLATRIAVKELRHQRQAVQQLASPRPYELRVGVSGFDPNGATGQRAALHLIVPARTYIAKGLSEPPGRCVGQSVRPLARLYERPVGALQFTLDGSMDNLKLSRLLTHLKDEADGTLNEVDLIIRRTPKPSEKDPVWTLFIAIPEGIEWAPPAVDTAAE